MESTFFVSFAVNLLITRSVVLKHWVFELSSADTIHAFFILSTYSGRSIAASLEVEIDIKKFVRTSLTGSCKIEVFSAIFVESTHFIVNHLFAACFEQFFST